MVRYETADTGEFRWARVESWQDAGYAVVRDTGRELTSEVRPGPPVTVETRQIADWGIWVEGRGVIEGAGARAVSLLAYLMAGSAAGEKRRVFGRSSRWPDRKMSTASL